MNLRINRTTGKNAAVRWIPGEGANSTIVLIFEAFYPLKLIGVPEMQLLAWSANREDMACAGHPSNGGNYISIVLSIKHLLDISSNGIPQVNSLSEAYSKNIILTPIQQIKIVIVNDIGSIQYLFGELRDTSDCLLLLLGFFLSQSLNERDILMKGHRRPRPFLFERENSLVRAIFLLLGPFLPICYPWKTELFILSLLQGKGVWRSALCREHTLSHELLETLLLLVAWSQRILSWWSIWRTAILNSISSPLSLVPFYSIGDWLTVNCSSIHAASWRVGRWRSIGSLI